MALADPIALCYDFIKLPSAPFRPEMGQQISITYEMETITLESANQALLELENRNVRGAKVLVMNGR